MARNFDGSGNTHLAKGSAPVTVIPFTLAGWVKMNATLVYGVIMQIGNTSSTDCARIAYHDQGFFICRAVQGATQPEAAYTGITPAAGVWSHVCGVWTNNTTQLIYVNGSNKTSNTHAACDPAGLNDTWIAAATPTSSPLEVNAIIAFPAIWNVALSDPDILSLSKGFSPRKIRPDKLVSYAKLTGNSPEPDYKGGSWTLTGTPPFASNPPVYFP
jgi:hypothetical protein